MHSLSLIVVVVVVVVCFCFGKTLSQFSSGGSGQCSCAAWTCSQWQTCGGPCHAPRSNLPGVYEEVYGGILYSVQANSSMTQTNSLASCLAQGFDGLVSLSSEGQRIALGGILTRSGFKDPINLYGQQFWTSMQKNVAGTTNSVTWFPSGSTYFQTNWWNLAEPSVGTDMCASLTSADPPTLNDAGCTAYNMYRICVGKAC